MSGHFSLEAVSDEASLCGLAGLELQHDFYLTLQDARAWSTVADKLDGAGGQLHSLQLHRLADGFSARARVKELSSENARELAALLLENGVAKRASVEHLMLTATCEAAAQ